MGRTAESSSSCSTTGRSRLRNRHGMAIISARAFMGAKRWHGSKSHLESAKSQNLWLSLLLPLYYVHNNTRCLQSLFFASQAHSIFSLSTAHSATPSFMTQRPVSMS